ncbi:hypothetical protein R1flu_005961 [Riccia fluitans]|uniref:pyridoxal 5'-phosphate synthase n=1 Tax=Riccia fluitans TaxID=41844 RepID=A0ABD1YXP1_9MARC
MASITPWRQLLLDSIQANKHLRHSEYFQLATVKENGRPANRTVVFRGFIQGTEKLQFTTDARSQKIEEIKTQAFGEICWYFTDSREQFRIGGFLNVIGNAETNPLRLKIREQAWFQSSLDSRLQFAGPSPGIPCVKNGPDDNTTPKLDPAEGPVENFCLVTLEPQEVDYLNLRKMKRYSFVKTGDFSWTQRELIP